MTRRALYTGPRYPLLETTAFDALSPLISDAPRSLLYVARSDHTARATRDRWAAYGPPLSLSVETFDSLVSRSYERDQFAGRSTHIDQPLRDRLVELAVETLDEPSNPLSVDDGLPASGLCQQVEDLLSLMEFADIHSPDAIRDRLADEGLAMQADTVGAVAEAFECVRSEALSPERTFRAERYHHVVESETALREAFPSVDAVVLGGFTLFSPLERRLVDRIAETWPTVALLPRVNETTEPVGVDRGAERALHAYHSLGFEPEYVDHDSSPGHSVARQLYRPTGVAITDDSVEDTISLRQPETLPHELRFVARDVRQRIAEGTPPEEIGVVLSNPTGYHERLVETFEQYDIPATLAIERSFGETALGEVVTELAALSRDDPPLASLTALLSNPLVSGLGDGTASHYDELVRVAGRLASRRLETALDHLGSDEAGAIQSFRADLGALRDADLTALPDRLDAVLDRLGVPDELEGLPKTPRGRAERAAARRLDRVLETLALTDGRADLDRGDAMGRLERALQTVTLDAQTSREDGHVLVCGLDEAAPRAFDHVYVLGLTMGHFPSPPERLAFTRPINEAHPDFEQTDVQQSARYHVGLLLASDASFTLSVPERDLAGDPYIEADVVTELRRVTGLDRVPVAPDDLQPGSREDVQRSLGRAFGHAAVSPVGYEDHIDRAAEAGTFDSKRTRRLQQGTALAAARASPALTEYDGRLSAETVAALHPAEDREPYSASRLETYAACGFKYYAQRVLGIEEPDDIALEPDARDRGGFVHDVLEHYYADLQRAPGDPVPIRGDRSERETHLLATALDCLDARFDDDPTAFQHQWLVDVLAGLGAPEDNEYYGDDAYGSPERGLLARFLDHEFEAVAKATALPAWFEPRVGSGYGDEVPLQERPVEVETPTGSVPIAGKIDRIDAVPGTSPTQVVVRDYKTGTTPSERTTLGGLAFQLPLYALLAEGVLAGVETVGGSYYQVRPPTSTNHRQGLVTSQEHASYYRSDEVDTPLLRASYPTFETHDAFRRFVEHETPARLGQLADAIENGAYHPTVLDPTEAGCRYCDYSDVCDVRSYRRRDVIDWIDETGVTAYVPIAATDADPADVLEVE